MSRFQRAAVYLSIRRDDPALDEVKKGDTPGLLAGRLWEAGKMEAARAAYLTLIEDTSEGDRSDYTRRQAALKLLPDASPAEKDRIRKALLPLLESDARGGNYLHTEEAARILRELCHPDCLEVLLVILPRTDSLHQRAARTATLAVRELGPEARQKGAARLIENLNPRATPRSEPDATIYLLEILWLGDESRFAKVAQALPASWRASWTALNPLWAIANAKDEGAVLIQLLETPGDLPVAAREWAAFRLGDLKEKRAVKVLTATLIGDHRWALTSTTRDALISIGGVEVETEMLALLPHEDRQYVRSAAVEVLFRLQGARSRDSRKT
jgi:hypothetical protein